MAFSILRGPAGPTFGAPNTANANAPSILTTTLADITAYKNVSIPIEGAGLLPITWSIDGGTAPNRALKQVAWTGGGLPSGLSFDQFTGQIRGKAAAPFTGASFTLRATNSAGTASRVFTLNGLDVSSGSPVFVTPSLPRAKVGVNYEGYDVAGRYIYVNGKTPMTYSIVSGSLPAGINMSSIGLLNGTPTTPGTYTFTVRATNSLGSADRAFTIEVVAAGSALPVILNAKIPDAVVNSVVMYHNTMVVASGAATPITWSTVANANPFLALPASLSINPSTGLINGTATATPGEYRFLVQATNAAGTDQAEIAITISPVPTAPSVNILKPTVNVWYELSS
jgi:large repetitive protein